jgi:hypothetical protein
MRPAELPFAVERSQSRELTRSSVTPFDVGTNGAGLRVDPAVLAGCFDHGEIALLPAFSVGPPGQRRDEFNRNQRIPRVGIPQLFDGIDFVPLAMGIFGFAEIVRKLEPHDDISLVTQKIKNLFPTREDFRRMMPAMTIHNIQPGPQVMT